MTNFEKNTIENPEEEKPTSIIDSEIVEHVKDADFSDKEFSQASISQVNFMAERSDIETSEDLLKTYSYLRETNSNSENIKSVNLATMSDQEIFNESLLILGRKEDSEKFKSDYPNIFKLKQEDREKIVDSSE